MDHRVPEVMKAVDYHGRRMRLKLLVPAAFAEHKS
jgi:hypothetical protein